VDFKVQISEAALTDVEEILAYSWQNLPESTERFGNALLNHAEMLGRFPYIGSPANGRPGVRQLVHTPIMIQYRVVEARGVVEVLSFRHGMRKGSK
jgi:plasmid stabilization system protein ParE